jgi:hypothetical protein
MAATCIFAEAGMFGISALIRAVVCGSLKIPNAFILPKPVTVMSHVKI